MKNILKRKYQVLYTSIFFKEDEEDVLKGFLSSKKVGEIKIAIFNFKQLEEIRRTLTTFHATAIG